MGVYQYDDPKTGQGYDLRIVGDVPTEEEFARLAGQIRQDRTAFLEDYEKRFGTEIEFDDGTALGRGFDRGTQQIKQAVGETVGTIGEQTGLGFLANYGQGVEERAGQELGRLSLTQPERMQSTDVKGSLSRGATYLGELVGEQIPQLGLGLGAAVAAPVLAGATGVAAPFLIGAGAAGVVTAPILFGNNIQRQEDEVAAGKKDRVDVSDALVATFGQAALEGVADKLLLGGVLKPIGKSIFTRTISRAGGGATSEGLTEVGQQMLERSQAGLPIDSEDAIAEYREAAIAGGLIGGGTRSTIGAFGDKPADVTPTTTKTKEETTVESTTGTKEETTAPAQTAEEIAVEAETAAEPEAETAAEPEVGAAPTVEVAKPDTEQGTQQKFDQAAAEFRAKRTVTKEMLDEIGVSRRAPLRKRITGLDVTDKAVEKELLKYAKNPNPKVKAKADKIKAGISALLGDTDATGLGTGTGTELTAVGTGAEGSGLSVEQLERARSAAGDSRELTTSNEASVGGSVPPTVVPAVSTGAKPDTLEDVSPEAVADLAQEVDAIVTEPVDAPSGQKDSPEAAAERRRIASDPAAYAAKVQQAKEASGYNAPAEVLVESDEIAARKATLAAGVADPVQVTPNAGLGGATLGTAGQNIPAPVAPAPRTAPLIGASLPQADLQAVEAQRDAAAQAQIERTFESNRGKQPEVREYHDTQLDPRSAPEVTTAVDKEGVVELLNTKDADLDDTGKAAKLYFKRFRRPVDALAEIGMIAVMGPTQSVKKNYTPKQFAFYKGMTQKSAMDARRWVHANMSDSAIQEMIRARRVANRDTSKFNPSDAYIGVVKAAKSIQQKEDNALKNQLNRYLASPEVNYQAPADLDQSLRAEATGQLVGERAAGPVTKTFKPVKGQTALESFLAGIDFKRRKVRSNETVADDTYTYIDKEGNVYVYEDTRAEGKLLTKVDAQAFYDDLLYSQNELGFLLIDPVHGLDMAILPSIRNALQRGDLQFALNAIAATSQVDRIREIAAKLARVVGTTKVQVMDDISPVAGRTAAGLFEPDTNTIYLDANNGMNVHTVLHEMAHAATSASLANPALPQTKQLQGLLNAVRAQFGEVYGTRNLDEFVAEAFSNPQFQSALAFLKTDGGRVSGWDKFTTAVRNIVRKIMGMQPKTIGSALDEVDRIINGMLTPSPATRAAPSMMLLSATKAGANKLAQSAANLAPETSAKVADLADVVYNEGISPKARSFALDMLPVNILTDMAKSKIPFAEELNLLIKQQSGALRKKSDVLDSILRNFHKWQRKNPDMTAILNNIIPQSTYLKVDPSRTDAAYMKTIRDDAERSPEYDKLRAKFLKLDEKGQDFYKQMRNYFQDTYDDIIAALEARLEATISDPTLRQNAFESLRKILQKDSGVIRPYFPLMRKGKYRLAYNFIDEDGRSERAVEYFPTLRKAEQASDMVLEYNKSPGDTFDSGIELTTATQTMSFDKVPSSGFIRDILKSVEFNEQEFKTNEGYRKVMQDLVDLSLDAMPERSFLQNLRRRKGVRGFIGDVTPTGMGGMEFDAYTMMKEKGRDLNRQLVQMKSAAEIEKFRAKLKPYKENPSTAMMANKMDKIAGFASSPNVPQYSQVVNSLGFGFTMGLNFSSAAITFFDVAMSAMPVLAGSHGIRNTGKAFGSATKLFAGAPSKRTVMVTGPEGQPVEQEIDMGVAGKSIANYDLNNLPEMLRNVRADILISMGIDQGQFNQSMVQEDLEVGRSAPMETVNKFSSFMFHHSERFNRETTLTAAYMLEVQNLQRKKGQLSEQDYRAAAQKAIDSTEFTLGSTAAAGRPIIAQSGIGNILFLFKRFAVSKYYMMAKLAKEAANDPDPEVRKAARKGGANFLIATGLFAGMGGMPMMGAIGAMYDMFADDDEDDFETVLRQYVGEGVYGGLANEILGVDLANRISLNSLLYRAPIIDKDQSALWTLIEQLGGPVIGVGLSVERGIGQVAEGEVYRGVEAMMPASIRNGMKSFRFAAEGATTRRGDVITSDINPYNVVMQGLGFAPQAYIQQLEANKNARRRADAVNGERTKLLRRRNMAIREGDRDELAKVERLIQEYNAGLPKDADTRKKVITADTKANSLRTFERTTGDMRGGITTTEFERSILDQYDF
jgi:hypothetical protein